MKTTLEGASLSENISKSSDETSRDALIKLGKRKRMTTESLSIATAESGAHEDSFKRAKQSLS